MFKFENLNVYEDAPERGFTLLELLVVTAILGILIGIATNVFLAVLRSQNKTTITNEVRQNATLLIDLFERDVRSAESVVESGDTNTVTLNYPGVSPIEWVCDDAVPAGDNRRFTRNGEAVTNTEPVTGVDIVCDAEGPTPTAFNVSGTAGSSQIVHLGFKIKQGVQAPTRNDYNIDLPFETTVGIRVF